MCLFQLHCACSSNSNLKLFFSKFIAYVLHLGLCGCTSDTWPPLLRNQPEMKWTATFILKKCTSNTTCASQNWQWHYQLPLCFPFTCFSATFERKRSCVAHMRETWNNATTYPLRSFMSKRALTWTSKTMDCITQPKKMKTYAANTKVKPLCTMKQANETCEKSEKNARELPTFAVALPTAASSNPTCKMCIVQYRAGVNTLMISNSNNFIGKHALRV